MKRTKLERAHAWFGNKSSFGKNEDGFAAAQDGFHFLDRFAARIRIAADEGNMLHLAQESADERHVAHFAFGDEAIRNAESAHQRENVEVAGVIRSVNLCSGCGHVLFARDANPNASEEEEKFYCSRCVAAGGAVIVEEKDASAGGNDPNGEQNDEVDAVEKLEAAAESAPCVAKEILFPAGRGHARD